jgi:trans-aconitate 2-methyltransferase
MPSWNTDQYLKFAGERTQPSRDLVARIALESPRRIIDLGCGPGNSAAVVAQRWPGADITGLDNSTAMLASARSDQPARSWIEGDITTWAAEHGSAGDAAAVAGDAFDVVFSNAALQWVPDHRRLFPRLLASVSPGGALAVQMPANLDAPPHRVMRELAAAPAWRNHFNPPPREWHVHAPEFYYDLLAPVAARIELWCTDYLHVLDGLDGIIEWYRGTGLRPWLEALPDEPTRAQFIGAYRARLVAYFPERSDGRVLFPFRRFFLIAYH